MTAPAAPATLWRVVLVLVLLAGLPAGAAAQEHAGQGEIEITITVLPSPPVETTWAMLTNASLVPAAADDPAHAASLEIVAADTRGSHAGWRVQITQVATGSGDQTPLWLTHYRRRAQPLAGQPVDGVMGPRGRRLAVGQPLTRPTPVFVAAPGAGSGVYHVELAVGTTPGANVTSRRLIVAIPSAP